MKGISQVATSAVIISITIAAVGIYSQWLPDFARESVGGFVENQEESLNCENGDLAMSGVKYYTAANNTEVTLSNSGSISFRENLTIAAVNSSTVEAQTSITELEVGEERTVEFSSEKKPDYVFASTQSCPSVSVRRETVEVQ